MNFQNVTMMLKSISIPAPPVTFHWGRARIALDVPMLLCALLAFTYSGPLLRQVDATAAAFDPGLLSALAYAAAAMLLGVVMARLLTAVLVRQAEPMVKPLNLLKPWQHVFLLAGLFCSLFWGFVGVLTALL